MSKNTNCLELFNTTLSLLKKELEENEIINLQPWDEIFINLNTCYEILNQAESPIDNYKIIVKHPIDQNGLGNITLALYEDGLTFQQIAEYHAYRDFKISKSEVQNWIENYGSKTIINKINTEFGSVFDTEYQLQSLFERLNTMLTEIDQKQNSDYAIAKTSKDEVYLAYCSEVRQTIKDAANLAEAIATMKNVEEFQRIVLETINEIDPSTKNKIIRKWKEHKNLFGI